MKLPTFLLASLVGLCAVAQQAVEPQLKLRILVDKEDYSLKEKVTVRAELTNITSKTLCFPVPDQDCETVATGFVVTPVNLSELTPTSSFVMWTAEARRARNLIPK